MFFTAKVSEEAAAHAMRCDAPMQDVGPLRDIGVSALNQETQVEPVEIDGMRQVAVLIYTSGTTGRPKGVMLTHRNLLFSAKNTANLRSVTAEDVQYCVLPISHVVGISLLTMTLMVGGITRLVTKYNPAALAKALAEEGITLLNGVPATYQRLLEYKQMAGLPKLERGALRLMGVSGAPLDLELKTRVEKELGLPLSNAFGITECSPGISGVRPEAPRSDVSVGVLVPGIQARIVARDGTIVTNGEIGELHVRGPNVMRGYYRAPDLTAKVIDPEGWFNTGDLARFEGDAMFIVGRTKEMIIRSGFNVYPAEIEAVLSTYPDVVQCAVVGRPVGGNEEIVAFVQLLAGSSATAQDLMAHVAPELTAGSIEELSKANAALVVIFPMMVLGMLAIIMLQVRSFSTMMMVILTGPLGLIGAVPALLLFHQPFGFNAILGLIGLAGILMRNTLILIGQIRTNEASGLDTYHAIVEATVQRARPVILTALAAVLAFIPLTHSVFWGAMAYTLIGGTAIGTILTLVFLPALYAIWFRAGQAAGMGEKRAATSLSRSLARRSQTKAPVIERSAQ